MERRGAAAPDGGYAWLILLSCFFVFGLTFGVIKSFGVFFVEIQQYFETTAAGTSWITSIAVATIHIAAPVSSALSARFSHRAVVISGGLICSAAVVFGALARSLTELYITVGFLNGFGYALTWTPTVTMLGLYFDRRRPVANALASAGECILTFSLTPLFQLLIDSFSWRGALLILGGLQLNLCVCGMLLRPLRLNVLEMNDQETVKDFQHYVDYTLITNGRFMVYSMFGVFAALGFFAPSLFLVPYARSQGLSEYQVQQLTATVVLLGAVLLLCPLASTFPELVAFSAAHGLVYGATVAVHITVLPEVVGVERLGSALGFFMLIRSSGGLLGPPIAGFFIDKMENYGMGFLMSGVALIVSALFLLILHQMNQQSQKTATDAALTEKKIWKKCFC
uniref:Major facilitator superfamily (MFS) profile domain-containing protein n=1 Tax=Poecilia mexicana TaxID=48701 RepID=A0A3B3X9D3_9TELE